jgi:hypothetical protein
MDLESIVATHPTPIERELRVAGKIHNREIVVQYHVVGLQHLRFSPGADRGVYPNGTFLARRKMSSPREPRRRAHSSAYARATNAIGPLSFV